MGAGPIVLVLVGLVIPILLLFAALVLDVAFLSWAAYRIVHDHPWKRLLHR